MKLIPWALTAAFCITSLGYSWSAYNGGGFTHAAVSALAILGAVISAAAVIGGRQ